MSKGDRITARLLPEVYTQLEALRELGGYKTISSALRDAIQFSYSKRTGTLENSKESGIRRSMVYSLRDDKFLHELVDKYELAVNIPDAVRLCIREYMTALEDGTVTIPGSTLEKLVKDNKDLKTELNSAKRKEIIKTAMTKAALEIAQKPDFTVSVMYVEGVELVLGAPDYSILDEIKKENLPEPQETQAKYVVVKETENTTVWEKRS